MTQNPAIVLMLAMLVAGFSTHVEKGFDFLGLPQPPSNQHRTAELLKGLQF